MTGIREVDTYIALWNPDGAAGAAPAVWWPGMPSSRGWSDDRPGPGRPGERDPRRTGGLPVQRRSSLDGADPVCFCGVVPGEAMAIDYVESCDDTCGMAWVRLIAVVPANGFGIPNTNTGNCGAALGIDIEVGMARCFPTPDDGGPPDAETQLAIAAQVNADMMVMRRAIACCPGSRDWVIDGYSPFGPQGGSIGGIWGLSLMVY